VPRLLAFTDPHGSLVAARRILDLARRERPRAILCAGDYSDFGRRFDGFWTMLAELGQDVYFVNGNHEDEATERAVLRSYPYLRPLEGRILPMEGWQLGGLHASVEYWPGGRLDPDDVEAALLELGAPDPALPFVLVSHYPPFGSPIAGLRHPTPDSGGSLLVRELVRRLRPAVVVSGHYHQDFGQLGDFEGVRVLNPGPEGRIFEV
jgi:Icc-related predicted phosphoesterase